MARARFIRPDWVVFVIRTMIETAFYAAQAGNCYHTAVHSWITVTVFVLNRPLWSRCRFSSSVGYVHLPQYGQWGTTFALQCSFLVVLFLAVLHIIVSVLVSSHTELSTRSPHSIKGASSLEVNISDGEGLQHLSVVVFSPLHKVLSLSLSLWLSFRDSNGFLDHRRVTLIELSPSCRKG